MSPQKKQKKFPKKSDPPPCPEGIHFFRVDLNIAIKHQNRLACLRVAASAKAGRGHCKSLVAEPFGYQALRSTNFAGVHFW